MTNEEWAGCNRLDDLLDAIQSDPDQRKAYFVAIAASRRSWSRLVDDRSRRGVKVLEGYLQGGIDHVELELACQESKEAYIQRWRDVMVSLVGPEMAIAAWTKQHGLRDVMHQDEANRLHRAVDYAPTCLAACGVWSAFNVQDPEQVEPCPPVQSLRGCLDYFASASGNYPEEQVVQARFVRDVYGPPERNVHFSRQLNEEIREIASEMLESGSFEQMPKLELAFRNLGLDDESLLGHCRESLHIPGCWLVDQILNIS